MSVGRYMPHAQASWGIARVRSLMATTYGGRWNFLILLLFINNFVWNSHFIREIEFKFFFLKVLFIIHYLFHDFWKKNWKQIYFILRE